MTPDLPEILARDIRDRDPLTRAIRIEAAEAKDAFRVKKIRERCAADRCPELVDDLILSDLSMTEALAYVAAFAETYPAPAG